MEKRFCDCGKSSVIYLPTGNYCSRCFVDKVHDAKKKTYKHLCSIGLGRMENERKEEWIQRMRTEFMARSKEKKHVY